MADHQTGAVIDRGPTDWQILQQDASGFGCIELTGRWVNETPGCVVQL